MKRFFLIAFLFAFTASLYANPNRTVRSAVGNIRHDNIGKAPTQQLIDQNEDTLYYADPDSLPWFLTIPNGLDDNFYNVRFTPLYAPFTLLEAHIALFDISIVNEDTLAAPGVRVIVFQSGQQYEDGEYGYPVVPIDSVDVPFDSLEFSESGLEPIFNVIDLRDLEISSDDIIDFHLAITVLQEDEEHDTLALLMDSGEFSPDSTRSGLWDGFLGEWAKLHDLPAGGGELMDPYNFGIKAVIRPGRVGVEDEAGYRDFLHPKTVILNPAFPNPFNNSTTVSFSIPAGKAYSLDIFDQSGRLIENVGKGAGGGYNSTDIRFGEVPAGVYFLRLATNEKAQFIKLHYQK